MRDRVVEGREYAEVERCLDMDIKRTERARPTDRKSIRQETPDPLHNTWQTAMLIPFCIVGSYDDRKYSKETVESRTFKSGFEVRKPARVNEIAAFRSSEYLLKNHIWRSTRISLVYLKKVIKGRYKGACNTHLNSNYFNNVNVQCHTSVEEPPMLPSCALH